MDIADILAADPDRAIMLAHVPPARKAAIATLWRLDLKGVEIVRSTTEAPIGQIRLTWWHDALIALDTAPAPAEPLLQAVTEALIPVGAGGQGLAEAIIGWELLLEPLPWSDAMLTAYAAARGAGLFEAAARALDCEDPRVGAAGRGWALVDLARHLGNAQARAQALALAAAPLAEALVGRWPKRLRALGMLAHFAESDRAAGAPAGRGGSPGRMLRALGFRLTGF